MDRLRADDVAQARETTPEDRLRQAFELMAQGIALKRANLRRQFPADSEAEIEARLGRWLSREDD